MKDALRTIHYLLTAAILTMASVGTAWAGSTTTALTTTPNPSALNQSVTLRATVTGSSPSGTVTFKDGTTTLGTGTLSSGIATLNYTFTVAGTHSLTAAYGGDKRNSASTSPAVSQTVNKATTSTTLTTSPNPSTAGQFVTLTATVTGSSPTGTVNFMDGANLLGSGTIAAGVATANVLINNLGTRSLTASYAGDANNTASTSAVVSQTVNKATTTSVLTTNPNPSAAGQAVTLTATVTGCGPQGNVTFMDGTTTLGTAMVISPIPPPGAPCIGPITPFQANLSYTFTTVGPHSLTAVYPGDTYNTASTSAPVSQTVSQATSTTALTVNPNPPGIGQAATLTATVTGAAPTGTITFKDGTTTLGTGNLSNGATTLSYTFAAGAHSLTASYAGDTNNTASNSTPLAVTVLAATTTQLTASPNPAAVNQVVNLTATVTGTNLTGTVSFLDGSTTIMSGVPINANGVASTSTSFTSHGTHSLTAVYSGDTANNPSTSPAVSAGIFAQTISYFHNDAAGTPLAATDASGNLLWSESYRAYGDPVQTPLDANNNLWYTGKPYDSSTQLTYLGARYYDPVLGRFMGTDPKGFDEKNLQSFNRYAYGNNNPNMFVDPDGREGKNFIDSYLQWRQNNLNALERAVKGDSEATLQIGLGLVGSVGVVGGEAAAGASRGAAMGGEAAGDAAKVADKWSREPKNLMDQMVLDAAQQGAGKKIIDNLRDPKFEGMEKWSYSEKSAAGARSEVHYVRNPETGETMDFKFKSHGAGE